MTAAVVAAIIRVAVYVRISQVEAQTDRAGVARQEAEIRAELDGWFGVGGWALVPDVNGAVWSDNGHSATTKRKRPAFERLMAACRFGHVDYVVCWSTDRLYRKASELERIIETFNEGQVGFRVVRQLGPIDLSTAAGRLIARNIGNFNQYEGEIKSERLQSQIRQMVLEGSPPATVARFGYRRVSYGPKKGATLEIVEAEAVIVRLVVQRLLDGLSPGTVATELYGAGHRNRDGKPFTREAVRRMVTSPIIAGMTVLNGEAIGRGNWEPIVDLIVWERLQAELTDPTRRHKRKRTHYWMRGDADDGNGLWDVYGQPLRGSRMAANATWPEGRRVYRTERVTVDALAVERFAFEVVEDCLDLIEMRLPGDTGDALTVAPHEVELRKLEAELAALGLERARGDLLPIEYQTIRVELVRRMEKVKANAPRQPRRPLRVQVRDIPARWPLAVDAGGLSEWEKQEIVRAAFGRTTVKPGGSGMLPTDDVLRARLEFEPIGR